MFRVVAKSSTFQNARLVRADLRESDFFGADFSEASLVEANL